ncbi:MAG: type I DNA topoisomerase [bacterium]
MSAKYLVIVESPAKIKTISKFLGSDYVIKASFGHVRDLPSKQLGIDIEKQFEPKYVTMTDKKKVIQELKTASNKAELVYIATDPDREGEAIAWHLVQALKLSDDKVRRVVFNEITKTAVKAAFENLRTLNVDLVNAQQARRVLDRLVGFEVSPVLWKKVKTGLSAGRVQSVAVRLIVEREAEINAFDSQAVFRVKGTFFDKEKTSFEASVDHDFVDKEDARAFLETCKSDSFKVVDIQKKDSKRSPSPPYTTSSLQQDASRKCRFSVSKTMQVAQRLYEAGHITYMRTDSVALSNDAVAAAKTIICDTYGEAYSSPKKYQTKSKGAQEAHEAIRPAYFTKKTAGATKDEQRLYDLIYQRALASQMSAAALEKTTVTLRDSSVDHPFLAQGEVIVFDGFLKLYQGVGDASDTKGFLPAFAVNDAVSIDQIDAKQRYSRPPARYTEASLVKKLEELGIGRPSTYAPTISTIQKRGYVSMGFLEGKQRDIYLLTLQNAVISEELKQETYGADKAKLLPSDIGAVVSKFLLQHFDEIMDYNFTASLEKQLDDIADGDVSWQEMIKRFYDPFHLAVDKTVSDAERESGERELGVDPSSKEPVIVRLGRYGPIAQIGRTTEDKKAKYASLLTTQSLDTITLEEALDLFKLPRELGEFEGEKVTAAIGRFGPYVRHKSTFVSLKEQDPMTVTMDEALVLIRESVEQKKKALIHEFKKGDLIIKVLDGRYGPYISAGEKRKKNYKIPKTVDPKTLTLDICLTLMNDDPKSKKKK